MKYEKAKVEVVLFSNEDVVTTSGECPGSSHHKKYKPQETVTSVNNVIDLKS